MRRWLGLLNTYCFTIVFFSLRVWYSFHFSFYKLSHLTRTAPARVANFKHGQRKGTSALPHHRRYFTHLFPSNTNLSRCALVKWNCILYSVSPSFLNVYAWLIPSKLINRERIKKIIFARMFSAFIGLTLFSHRVHWPMKKGFWYLTGQRGRSHFFRRV